MLSISKGCWVTDHSPCERQRMLTVLLLRSVLGCPAELHQTRMCRLLACSCRW